MVKPAIDGLVMDLDGNRPRQGHLDGLGQGRNKQPQRRGNRQLHSGKCKQEVILPGSNGDDHLATRPPPGRRHQTGGRSKFVIHGHIQGYRGAALLTAKPYFTGIGQGDRDRRPEDTQDGNLLRNRQRKDCLDERLQGIPIDTHFHRTGCGRNGKKKQEDHDRQDHAGLFRDDFATAPWAP